MILCRISVFECATNMTKAMTYVNVFSIFVRLSITYLFSTWYCHALAVAIHLDSVWSADREVYRIRIGTYQINIDCAVACDIWTRWQPVCCVCRNRIQQCSVDSWSSNKVCARTDENKIRNIFLILNQIFYCWPSHWVSEKYAFNRGRVLYYWVSSIDRLC